MKNRRGFTLIEVLVALVVAVAAMSLISQGFMTGARASATSQNATRAALYGQRVLTDYETGELDLTSPQSGTFDDDPDFSYETQVEASSDVVGLNKLTVVVKWRERNDDRTYQLVRLMRDRPSTTTTTPSSSSSSSSTKPK
jgi:prepilin-type N-terminal cleavage/methylation domain-containing protein